MLLEVFLNRIIMHAQALARVMRDFLTTHMSSCTQAQRYAKIYASQHCTNRLVHGLVVHATWANETPPVFGSDTELLFWWEVCKRRDYWRIL
jgi:hypothetical protein